MKHHEFRPRRPLAKCLTPLPPTLHTRQYNIDNTNIAIYAYYYRPFTISISFDFLSRYLLYFITILYHIATDWFLDALISWLYFTFIYMFISISPLVYTQYFIFISLSRQQAGVVPAHSRPAIWFASPRFRLTILHIAHLLLIGCIWSLYWKCYCWPLSHSLHWDSIISHWFHIIKRHWHLFAFSPDIFSPSRILLTISRLNSFDFPPLTAATGARRQASASTRHSPVSLSVNFRPVPTRDCLSDLPARPWLSLSTLGL
jgi:hypothetical protein